MPTYVQPAETMTVATPLGKDALILVGLSGREAISELFRFQLDLLAENKTDVPFEKLLGQAIGIGLSLPRGKVRYFHGLCSRLLQGGRDEVFTSYRIEMVPAVWLLTRRLQSRIFQQISVPDILKKIFDGFDVAFEIQGTYYPRDFCVQYQESDFAFASRLMEEEGIFYFFKHAADGHKMVVANTAQSHPDVPEQSKVIFETTVGGTREELRVTGWQKVQELRSGKYTLWDHCFELPHKHLEAEQVIQDTVAAGKVVHKLKVANNDKLEVYNFPGAYAQRFDGVDKGGSPQPAELEKIFQDNKRAAIIRMQAEAAAGLAIEGAGNCGQFVSGHKFTLERHFNADGQYLLTGVQHTANLAGDLRSGKPMDFSYSNTFTCIPIGLPFRPPRVTPRPVIHGTQTAVVVGPMSKEEIFTDKYGRVKVQFHWDRQGKYDADSSCWIRVATAWAGKGWGQINIPRIGHEVIVDFLEGDPDNPIIVGSVYNAENMPAQKLPAGRKISGLVTRSNDSTLGGSNQISCDDNKGSELIKIHGEYDMKTDIDHDEFWHVKNNREMKVDVNNTVIIGGIDDTTVKDAQSLHVVKVQAITLDANRNTKIEADDKLVVKNQIDIESTGSYIHLKASDHIQLLVGSSKLLMKSDGSIELSGKNIAITGDTQIDISSDKVISEGTSSHDIKGGIISSKASGNNTVAGATVLLNP